MLCAARPALAFVFLLAGAPASAGTEPVSVAGASSSGDQLPAGPLAEDLGRWRSFVESSTAADEISVQVLDSAKPVLEAAATALKDGRHLLALQRLTAARTNLAALAYVRALPPGAREPAGFEAEWTRMGGTFGRELRGAPADSLGSIRSAAVRAIAEAALAQVRVYYEASLDYGRSTAPENGLFYLGAAKAQQEIAAFCRTLDAPGEGAAPPVRSIAGEIDALEKALLLAYRPPAAIDRHPEFITASGTLKEARELSEKGLRHGALLKYLQAAQRLAAITAGPPGAVAASDAEVAAKLKALGARLGSSGRDDSIARLFLEIAEADLEGASAAKRPVQAAVIASDVLPRYFAALEPAAAVAARPPAKVTVTLVRWPYT